MCALRTQFWCRTISQWRRLQRHVDNFKFSIVSSSQDRAERRIPEFVNQLFSELAGWHSISDHPRANGTAERHVNKAKEHLCRQTSKGTAHYSSRAGHNFVRVAQMALNVQLLRPTRRSRMSPFCNECSSIGQAGDRRTDGQTEGQNYGSFARYRLRWPFWVLTDRPEQLLSWQTDRLDRLDRQETDRQTDSQIGLVSAQSWQTDRQTAR